VYFNSIGFFLFFIAVYVAYRLVSSWTKAQNLVLVLASYVFYAAWDWRFLFLIVGSTLGDYWLGLCMVRRPTYKKRFLLASLAMNLGVLFMFKYFGFFVQNFVALMQQVGLGPTIPAWEVILPLGISFFTFQKMTYTIELHRGNVEPTADLVDFALFVCFFPLLLSGPIERAKTLLPQIRNPRLITSEHGREGLWLIAWGLFKKVYVADNLAQIVDPVFAPNWHGTGSEVLIALYAYAGQIYCDFSGYTDIARGVAKLLGFDVRLNFNLPYLATNPSDFWRRWHMSLSTWLRDYVYIPLGGSREGLWKTCRNLFVTMVLVGLWHGAAWTFIVWGAYHGVLLVLHRLASAGKNPWITDLGFVGRPLGMVGMFHLTCLGWLFFRAQSLGQASDLGSLIVVHFAPGAAALQLSVTLLGYLSAAILLMAFHRLVQSSRVPRSAYVPLGAVVYGLLFYFTVLHGGVSDSFIYAQF